MGVLIKWKKITAEATYDTVRIYRSAGEDGSYSLIGSQTIADNSYYDPQGIGSSWYKVDFYDSVTGNVSEKSDATQGGTYYGYCTVDEVRQVTNINTSNINDTQLATLIQFACTQLNNDINVYHEEERVEYISETKENKIDGVNSTYYTKKYPFGDRNNDFRVTVSDVEVYQVDSDGTKTELIVTQIDVETGEFRLSTAPESDKDLYVTYSHTQRLVDPVDTLIKMACILLTAAWGYSKLNIGKATRFHMGNLTVFRHMDAHHEYYKKYVQLIAQINDRAYTRSGTGKEMPAELEYELSKLNNSGV